MSTLKADTLVASDGTSPVTLTKQSAAKAWVGYWEFSSNTSRDSFNFSSATDNGSGDVTFTFVNNFDNANFSTAGMNDNFSLMKAYSETTSTSRTTNYNTSYAGYDVVKFHHSVHGDLA